MSWILIKQPHPLDAIWQIANERHEAAREALDALPDTATQDEEDAASDAVTQAELAILALPARSMDDCIIKLMVSGMETGDVLTVINPSDIVNEMVRVLDEACQRGRNFTKERSNAE